MSSISINNNEDIENASQISDSNLDIDDKHQYNNGKRKKRIAVVTTLVFLAIILTITLTNISDSKDEAKQPTQNTNSSEITKDVLQGRSFDPRINALRFDTVNLPKFSSSILDGYASCSNLEKDIIEAGKYRIKFAIEDNLKIGMTEEPIYWIMEDSIAMESIASAPVPASVPLADSSSSNSNVKSKSGEDSYGTNNQVEGVDEADIVKSDGEYVYAVYGNDIVVITLDGNIVSRITVPLIENDIPKVDFWDYEDNYYGYPYPIEYNMMPPMHIADNQDIQSILLDDDRLLVLATAYFYGGGPKMIGSDMTGTFLYQIDKLNGSLTLIESKSLRGNYQNARSIGGKAYVVTSTYVNSYDLTSPLDRYNKEYWNMTDDEYVLSAEVKAAEYLPKFAKQLMVELFGEKENNGAIDDNSCKNIVQLSLMQTGDNADKTSDPTSGSGVLNAFAQVLSFDMHSTLFYKNMGIAGAFLPTKNLDVYANDDMLILGGRGWTYTNSYDWREYTYLMGFEYQNGIAKPSSVGSIKGYTLNQFSMDFHNDHLRVATTSSSKWGVINETTKEYGEISPSENQVVILKKKGQVFEVTGNLTSLGVTESIYAVRFLGDEGFVVTFRQIDPLFALNLTDPTNPSVAGELKIPGFSNYIHPVDGGYLLAVGQDANETTGALLGLQVSLFNVQNLSDPILMHKSVVEGWSRSSSQYDHHSFRYLPETEALILPVSVYDKETTFDGFYIYDINKEKGIKKLGQVVHVDNDYITKFNCYSNSYLQPRSLVFNSKLMTLKGHTVMMGTNVSSPEMMWRKNLDIGAKKVCYPWFSM